MCQHRNVIEIAKKQLNKDFESIQDWFVDNKLPTHFGDGKIEKTYSFWK